MSPADAVELQWEVDGLRMAGLAWGERTQAPVLALHGWLDNAASFACLAPCLAEEFYVVAPDLTGHGGSDWRSADATYQVYDDVPQLHGLVSQLGWERFGLIGHSRGAIIASLFSACFPGMVSPLVLLDGISPPPLPGGAFVSQLRQFVLDRERLQSRRPRVFTDQRSASRVREEQGLSPAAAGLIARRNLRAVEGGYTWTMDPRLRGASAVKMTPEQVDAMLSALPGPVLLLLAEGGLAGTHSDKFVSLGERIPDLIREWVPGSHHFHMEEGVDKLGSRIARFLREQH